ncbi:uncharacterized protein K444DRAFT_204391 [Hyaloscypha bicolor E]|uniref:Uncharacterized protein n=1 Tax=Hyaloscypha bicolor E TaxID=1095630 RepID=A0A2J6TNX5_9HELO|nr:uncharacterized protein K444DRAFT_204391 [Hyaloscypha bicolor E]PMD64710.1 hypothetical protein K444DRAFT_204391 [Hyaloscypha bicolor E]
MNAMGFDIAVTDRVSPALVPHGFKLRVPPWILLFVLAICGLSESRPAGSVNGQNGQNKNQYRTGANTSIRCLKWGGWLEAWETQGQP